MHVDLNQTPLFAVQAGFYSIVQKAPTKFHIRACVRQDLENLGKQAGIDWEILDWPLEAIEFYPMSDANTQLRAFETGQLHVSSSVPENMQTHYEEKYPQRIRFDPGYHSVFCAVIGKSAAACRRRQ